MKKIISTLAIAVLGGAAALGLNTLFFAPQSLADAVKPQLQTRFTNLGGASGPVDFREAADQTIHAVVHVTTKFTTNQTYYDPFQGFFGGGNGMQVVPREQQSSGSGVIISNDGYIVTNYHVVESADNISVTLNDKRTYEAKVIGTDPNTDLAVIKIDETALPFVAYGNSDEVKVGEWVLAVGNPFNLNSTVTAGIVSAKARNINIISTNGSGSGAVESFIQTDAAVNPGNSGGALVNTSGQLIGINSAIASSTGSFAGYSFAIPVNLVRKVVADLMEFGTVQRGYLGVNIRDVNASLVKEKNLEKLSGVYVEGVIDGGSAADVGIEGGDVITRVGDIPVNNVPELQEQINRFRPGDKVAITYARGSKEKVVTVMLKNKNNSAALLKKDDKVGEAETLGATFETIAPEDMKRLNIENGLRVSKLGAGKLRNSGIREGFIITTIDKNKVTSPEELKRILDIKKGGILIEGVYPNGSRAYYAFGM
ncbi:MAG: Do family serine endopeptidase [Bacteroidota bacterium]|nr:Do family serine endopeptidase [Bacteroidota bacterium]